MGSILLVCDDTRRRPILNGDVEDDSAQVQSVRTLAEGRDVELLTAF